MCVYTVWVCIYVYTSVYICVCIYKKIKEKKQKKKTVTFLYPVAICFMFLPLYSFTGFSSFQASGCPVSLHSLQLSSFHGTENKVFPMSTLSRPANVQLMSKPAFAVALLKSRQRITV